MNNIFNILNAIVIITLVILALIFTYQRYKTKKTLSKTNPTLTSNRNVDYSVDYVQDFLDFDKIYSDMIIRDKGTKFTMVIHCSGINYDLLSEHEKTMVEESFIELLNFIQFPIQIYVQTRKVDLKDSLKTYNSKIMAIENEMKMLLDEFSTLKAENVDNTDHLAILAYEIQRKQNLLEYAVDLKNHIEMMSVNKNVLQQKYYIAITYYIEELGLMTNFTSEEIQEMAYSELYTRCHSVIGALGGCNIDAKIVDSNGLAELLYMAFNRDDADIYRLKDNMEAGFYRLYSTTENAMIMQENISGLGEGEQEQLLLPEGFDLSQLNLELLLENAKEKIGA